MPDRARDQLADLVTSDGPLDPRRQAMTALVRLSPADGADQIERLLTRRGASPADRAVAFHGCREIARTQDAAACRRLARLALRLPEAAAAMAHALAVEGRREAGPLLHARLAAGAPPEERSQAAALLASHLADWTGLEAMAAELTGGGSPLTAAWAAFDAVPAERRTARYADLVTRRLDPAVPADRLRDLLLLLDTPTRLGDESIRRVARLLADERQTDLPSHGLRRPLADLAAYVLARCALAAPWYHQAELLLTSSAPRRQELRRQVEAEVGRLGG